MQEIKLTQTCTNESKFIAEIKINGFSDLTDIYKSVCNSSFFKSAICLSRGEVVWSMHGRKSIMIFRNGRITVNCVRNEKEASEIVRLLIRILRLG